MNIGGLTDSVASLTREAVQCPRCHGATTIAQGLCLSCLFITDVGDENPADNTLEATLDAINMPDTHWRLGSYEILEEIGRGGMGVIYRARQRHSRRIVALKRILSYHADSRDSLARFRREAEAAASLDHPNILPIYEVGESEEGVPFFSMKYAPGGSLQEVGPALRRNPREIVRLMAKVTRAVEYAHGQGILHRDLKPGNILLDHRGEPLVSDFGLAKWLDATSDLTRTLTVFGTPGYIAPEQADGPAANLTSAADIYSLGAILFDLLARRPPFVGEHAIAVIRQATQRPAPKLRSLVKGADRDLETICARCLECEPEARYQSAGDLALDLERWLEGRPIIARPVWPPMRVYRWSRRNPTLAQAAAAIIMLLILTTSLFVWQLHTQAATKVEMEKLRRSVIAYPQVEAQVRQPGEEVTDENGIYAELGKQVGLAPQVLNEKLTKVAATMEGSPTASNYERAHAAYVAKNFAEAERMALVSVSDARKAIPVDARVIIQGLTLAGLSAESQIQYTRAMGHFRDAERETDVKRNAEEWAKVQNYIADLLFDQGKYGESEQVFRQVIATRSRVLGPEDPETLGSRNRLIYVLNNAEKGPEAEKEARELVALREKNLGSEHPDTLLSSYNLANALYHQGKYAEAEILYRRVLDLDEKVIGKEHRRTLAARVGLANTLNDQGKHAEAETSYRAVVKLDNKVYGPEHPVTLNDRMDLATVLQAQRKYPAAEAEYRPVINLQQKVLGPEHENTLNTRNNFAEMLDDEGKFAEADAECRQIIGPEEKVAGPNSRLALNTRANLAVALIGEGKFDEAAAQYKDVIKLMEASLGLQYPDTVSYITKFAQALARQKRFDDAIDLAQAATDRARSALGPDHVLTQRYTRLLHDLQGSKR